MHHILDFMRNDGGDADNYENYCIGMTNDDLTQLLDNYKDLSDNGSLVFDSVPSADTAAYLVDMFQTLGMCSHSIELERKQGNSVVVYCYRKPNDE